MKKNNAMKKLMSATAMLGVSAAMLATSTYAWFTMNTHVTLDGMQLTVKADSTYLIIGPESTAAGLQAQNRSEYTFDPVSSLQVFPSAHTDTVANTGTAGTVANWYYKYADTPSGSESTSAARAIDSAKFGTDYVLHKEIYVTLAEGSETATNLRCTDATLTTTNVKTGEDETFDAVTVLVTSATACDEEDAGDTFALAGTQLAATLTDSTVVKLDVWIYYNGNDASVFTNNIANLEGATVELAFDVDYSPNYNA